MNLQVESKREPIRTLPPFLNRIIEWWEGNGDDMGVRAILKVLHKERVPLFLIPSIVFNREKRNSLKGMCQSHR